MPRGMSSGVTFKGPFFEAQIRKRAIRRAVSRQITRLVRTTRDDVRGQLYKGHGRDTGTLQQSIASRKYGQMIGKVYIKTTIRGDTGRKHGHWRAQISGPFIEGVSRRNQTTRFKGYHVFRAARGRLEAVLHSSIVEATAQAVKELN